MVRSLLIKLVMFGMTVATVVWIGWTVPDSNPTSQPLTLSAVPMPEGTALSQSTSHEIGRAPGKETAAADIPAISPKSERARVRSTTRIDLNRATAEELDRLPGIGPALAKRILDRRKSVGKFRSVEELRGVKGIGAKKMERIRPLVMVKDASAPSQGNQL